MSAPSPSPVSVLKLRQVSNGVSLCRLNSGEVALSVHRGDDIAVIDLSVDELADFLARASAFLSGVAACS
jgi:hypothetical protein